MINSYEFGGETSTKCISAMGKWLRLMAEDVRDKKIAIHSIHIDQFPMKWRLEILYYDYKEKK
jgi:hypothetical protein